MKGKQTYLFRHLSVIGMLLYLFAHTEIWKMECEGSTSALHPFHVGVSDERAMITTQPQHILISLMK